MFIPRTAIDLRLAARVLGTIVMGVVLLAIVPLSQVADAIWRANPGWAIAGIMLSLLARLAAAERTFSISKPMSLRLSRRQTIETLFISNFWSLLLPGVSAGTVATIYRYRAMGISLALSVGALGASRVVEVIVYCALTTVAWAASAANYAIDDSIAIVIASAGCAMTSLLIGVCLYLRSLSLGSSSPPVVNPSSFRARLNSVALALRSVSPRAYAGAAVFATIQALLDAASLAVFARALNVTLDMIGAVWVNGLAYLAILLPISIAGLGARDAAVVAATTPLNMAAHDALAIAVLMLAATLVNAFVGGVVQFFTVRSRPASEVNA